MSQHTLLLWPVWSLSACHHTLKVISQHTQSHITTHSMSWHDMWCSNLSLLLIACAEITKEQTFEENRTQNNLSRSSSSYFPKKFTRISIQKSSDQTRGKDEVCQEMYGCMYAYIYIYIYIYLTAAQLFQIVFLVFFWSSVTRWRLENNCHKSALCSVYITNWIVSWPSRRSLCNTDLVTPGLDSPKSYF